MAIYSTGLEASWGGVPFGEIYELSLDTYGGPRKDRSSSSTAKGWSDEVGTVTIGCYGVANMNTAQYGLRKQLVITGGGISLTIYGHCIGLAAVPEVNGLARFTFTIKLLDF